MGTEVPTADFHEEQFAAYAGRYDELFARADQRECFRLYLRGLLTAPERKNVGAIAAAVGGHSHDGVNLGQALQHFVTDSPWDHNRVLARYRQLLPPATRGGMKITCSCTDATACAMMQNLCGLMAGGMVSCCCMMNGMMVCCRNMTMGMCKCEMTKDGCCVTCTSGDKACEAMIQGCCDCMTACMKAGCTCCVMMGGTPVACGCC